MRKISKRLACTIITMAVISTMMPRIYARDNWAYAAGLTYQRTGGQKMDSYKACYNALEAYQKAGYNVGGDINPNKATLWKNLYATVQFFRGHGNSQHINLSQTGIVVGEDMQGQSKTAEGDIFNLDLIGTKSVHWSADTILVTYLSCHGAQNDGQKESLAYSTAVNGADVVVAFKDEVQDSSGEHWAERYNQRLGEGYGVEESVDYANSYIYIFNSVKENVVFHHGNSNLKIGKYGNSSKSILKEYKRDSRNISTNNFEVEASEENIQKQLKNVYENFDVSNYIVEKRTSKAINVLNNETTKERIYYDYILKIGDYITNAAYTVAVENNKIVNIYDNNIDINKQEELLRNSEKLKIDTDNDYNIENAECLTQRKIAEKYNDKVEITNKEYIYYYDIKEDKKYIVSSYTTEIDNKELEKSIAIDNYKCEIF